MEPPAVEYCRTSVINTMSIFPSVVDGKCEVGTKMIVAETADRPVINIYNEEMDEYYHENYSDVHYYTIGIESSEDSSFYGRD